jgi:hypothetical protein
MKQQTFNRAEKKTEKLNKMEKAYNALQKRLKLEAEKKKEPAA